MHVKVDAAPAKRGARGSPKDGEKNLKKRESASRVSVAGEGGELWEHLDGRHHSKCSVVAVRAWFERRHNRLDWVILC